MFIVMDDAKWFEIGKYVNLNNETFNVKWDNLIMKIFVIKKEHWTIKMQMKFLTSIEYTRIDEWCKIEEGFLNFFGIEIFE